MIENFVFWGESVSIMVTLAVEWLLSNSFCRVLSNIVTLVFTNWNACLHGFNFFSYTKGRSHSNKENWNSISSRSHRWQWYVRKEWRNHITMCYGHQQTKRKQVGGRIESLIRNIDSVWSAIGWHSRALCKEWHDLIAINCICFDSKSCLNHASPLFSPWGTTIGSAIKYPKGPPHFLRVLFQDTEVLN